MKKIRRACVLLALAFALQLFAFPVIPSAIAVPSRVINVVYDDSGSMYSTDGVGIVAWSQAKYAAEVFAAMLGDTDAMNIYLMSDFVADSTNRSPRLQLHGRDGAERNVNEIHNMITQSAQGTPFSPVQAAYDDLLKENAGDKWLVILTDGDFEGEYSSKRGDAAISYLRAKSPDVNVYFIAFGDEAVSIPQDASNNIFFEHARSGPDLLEKITNMCTRIFNFNKLRVDTGTKHFEFDVPMRALTVFAQGQNVSVNGIVDQSGVMTSSVAPVHVQYSTQPALNYANAPYDSSLNGYLAEFSRNFPTGNYTLSVDGADTIEIYYKPDVEIDVFLTDENGREVTSDRLEAGEYTLNFCFVKQGTKDRLPYSALLGEITYSANIVSNGIPHNRQYSQGDSIMLEEGSHRIDAKAVYLEYNTVYTDRIINIYQNKEVTFSQDQAGAASYSLTEFGFDRDTPVRMLSEIDGREYTADEWAKQSAPDVLAIDGNLSFRAEKGDIGEFLLYPVFTGKTREDAESSVGQYSLQLMVSTTTDDEEMWIGAGVVDIIITSGYRDIRYTPVSVPEYEIDKNGIANIDEPIIVQAKVEGREITAAEWSVMRELPSAETVSGNIGPFRVEKTSAPGQYALYPTLFEDSLAKTDAVNSEIMFSYFERIGNEVWTGDGTGEGGLRLKMNDTRTWLDRNLEKLIRWAIIALIILLILGYIPPLKKYLPRSLKPKPTITCTLRRPGPKPPQGKGTLKKSLSSKLIPYKAEKGTVKFLPKGVSGAPVMAVKADGRNTMFITNTKAFAGKDNITFNGESIQKEASKPKIISAGVLIEVRTDTMTYTCQPNS